MGMAVVGGRRHGRHGLHCGGRIRIVRQNYGAVLPVPLEWGGFKSPADASTPSLPPRSYLMSRGRGFRGRPRDLPYARAALHRDEAWCASRLARMRSRFSGVSGPRGSRPDGVWVSMVLTSQAHLRRTPKNNRRISTIPAGNIDARSSNVSAVDTVSRRSESGVLATEPGAFVTGPPHRSLTAVCAGARFEGLGGGLGVVPTRHLGKVLVVMVRRRPRLESARVGLLHEGRDLLAKGCAYCTKAPPTPNTPDPRPVAPYPRAVHPDDDGSHHSDRACPSPAD